MSICSSVYISREEARERVKSRLLHKQEELIVLAVNSMSDFDLTSELSCDLYDYNIEKPKKTNVKKFKE